MKLIVGLGNVGKEYNNTRHNVGFMALDELARIYNADISKEKFGGYYDKVSINNEDVILLKPARYINLSGEVIIKFINYFKINIEDVFIICDDLDLEVGKYKLKAKGSSGGHNGLKNIALHLKTDNYKRLKIGISNNKNIDTKDYVLGKISQYDQVELNKIITLVPKIIFDFIELSFDNLMNKYNHK